METKVVPIQWSNGDQARIFAGQAKIHRERSADKTVYTIKTCDGAKVAVNRKPVNETEIFHGDVLWHEGKSFIFYLDQPPDLPAKPNGARITVCGLNVPEKVPPNGKKILHNLSVLFPADSFTAVMGPSGCGKTTFMNYIIAAGDKRPGSKAVRIDADCARPRIGFVPQDDVVYPLLSVQQNLEYAATIRLPNPDARPNQVGRVIESLNLQHLKDRLANCISGGERKRLSIGIELVGRPQALILDEPTNGLDPKTAADLLEQLLHLSIAGLTVICVTHDLAVLNYASRLVLLRTLAKPGVQAASSLVYYGPCGKDHLQDTHKICEMRDLYAWENNDGQSPLPAREAEDEERPYAGPRPPLDNPTLHERLILGWRVLLRSCLALYRSPNSFFPTLPTLRERLILGWRVLHRSCLALYHSRNSCFSTLLTPLALVLLVYYGARLKNAQPHCLFWAVSAVWVGMSLSIREVVGEKPNYERDLRAGMPFFSHLSGKIAYCLLGTLVQALIIALAILSLAALGGRIDALINPIARDSFFQLLLPCWLASATGAMCGLSISSLSATENMAVNLMPIMLIPNLLFSSYIITGPTVFNSSYTKIWADRISARIPSEHLSKFLADGDERLFSALFLLLFWVAIATVILAFRHAMARRRP